MLVLWMAVITGAMRFAEWSAGWITLWYLYGWARVQHDHLRMLRTKPLRVSNGDVLAGMGEVHFVVGVVIWIPLAMALLTLIFYRFIPLRLQAILRERQKLHENANAWALLVVLPLAYLVTALLPTLAALTLAGAVAAGALIWLRRIPYDFDPFG